jgi:hypothetical protein
VAAGGDDARVDGISFNVDDPEEQRAHARERAVEDARAHAEQLANAAGVALGRARAITESFNGTPPPMPVANRAAAQGADVDTPLNPGETDITVTVSVVYEIE